MCVLQSRNGQINKEFRGENCAIDLLEKKGFVKFDEEGNPFYQVSENEIDDEYTKCLNMCIEKFSDENTLKMIEQSIGFIKCQYLEKEYHQLLLETQFLNKEVPSNFSIEGYDKNLPKTDYFQRAAYIEHLMKEIKEKKKDLVEDDTLKAEIEYQNNHPEITFRRKATEVLEYAKRMNESDAIKLGDKLKYENRVARFQQLTKKTFQENDDWFGNSKEEKVNKIDKFCDDYVALYQSQDFKTKYAEYKRRCTRQSLYFFKKNCK